jgi:hypothetical protein
VVDGEKHVLRFPLVAQDDKFFGPDDWLKHSCQEAFGVVVFHVFRAALGKDGWRQGDDRAV